MLRCDGCGVLHHPGCWVTNGGCGTQTEHHASPSALAYSNRAPIGGAQAPHPGEGTRVITSPPPVVEAPIPEPIPFRPMRAPAPEHEDDAPVIGAATPAQMVHRTLPSTVGTPASAPRRYQPPPGDHMPRKTMPQIYDRPRILAYWYIPAAALVAIIVALSVIWLVGQFTGDDSEKAGDPTPAATTAGGGIATTQPTASANTVVPTTVANTTRRRSVAEAIVPVGVKPSGSAGLDGALMR